MTDSKLRKLERASASGDVEAEAKLLLERVRAGELSEEKLRLAAYLGHESARLALGDRAPEEPEAPEKWVRGLVRQAVVAGGPNPVGPQTRRLLPHDQECLVRIGVAAARRSLVSAPETCGADRNLTNALEAVETWLTCPCSTHAEACAEANVIAENVSAEDYYMAGLVSPVTEGALVCVQAATATVSNAAANVAHSLDGVLQAVEWDAVQVLHALQAELLPWALGLGDPVRDRVEARKREGGE